MFLFSIAKAVVKFALAVIRAIVQIVIKVMMEILKQIVQEIIERISGNEDFFNEMLSYDPIYRRYSLILRDAEDELPEEPTEEDIQNFAAEQAQAVAANLQKEWRTNIGGSASGVCHHCNSLDGTVVGVNDLFSGGNWVGMGPPRHPNCCCRIKVSFG